jgi:hypothetical protein
MYNINNTKHKTIDLIKLESGLYELCPVPYSSLILVAVFSRAPVFFPAGRKVFRDFLRCEYSEENILFWLACEELKNETNPDAVEEKARFIYEDYISILSPKEVIIKE